MKETNLYQCKFCSELLDPSFLFSLDNGERFSVQPMRFTTLLNVTRVKVSITFGHCIANNIKLIVLSKKAFFSLKFQSWSNIVMFEFTEMDYIATITPLKQKRFHISSLGHLFEWIYLVCCH